VAIHSQCHFCKLKKVVHVSDLCIFTFRTRLVSYPHTGNTKIELTPRKQSRLYTQPPSKQLPRTVIITLDNTQRFTHCILPSTVRSREQFNILILLIS